MLKDDRKRKEAEERQATAASMTALQRLETLDRRLGKGMGAAKERARLVKMLSETEKKQYEGAAKETSQSEKFAKKYAKKT